LNLKPNQIGFALRGLLDVTTFGKFAVRTLGTLKITVQPFWFLIRLLPGTTKDVDLLERACAMCARSGSESSFQLGYDAAQRLLKEARKLPPAQRDRVMYEIEARLNTLNARRQGFGKLVYDAGGDAASAAPSAGKAVGAAVARAKVAQASGKVLAELGKVTQGAKATGRPLFGIWRHFSKAVSGQSRRMREIAEYAAVNADAIKNVLKDRSRTALQKRQALTGYLVKIRGDLLELYALSSERFKVMVLRGMTQRARAVAAKLGPDHKVLFLTQAEHGLTVNGSESADAMMLIVNRKTGVAIPFGRFQAKAANLSEGAAQLWQDMLRDAGMTTSGAAKVLLPSISFELKGVRETFLLGGHPSVVTEMVLINAAGARHPAADVKLLETMGYAVSEFSTDLNLSGFTEIAIGFMEAAVAAF
jgi:hypothetical protein